MNDNDKGRVILPHPIKIHDDVTPDYINGFTDCERKTRDRITALETALADAVRERDEARGYVQKISNMTGFRCTNEDCPAVQAHIYINGLRKVTR